MSGNFGLASQLIPEKLEVSAVDASMKKISTRSAKIMRDRTDFSFWVEEQEYPVRVARFKFTCAYPYPNDSMKMEFVSYLPVESRQSVTLDIFSALLSTRIEKIVKEAEVGPEDIVLEVGPGIGTLTQYLASRAAFVTAVEIDSSLIPILGETLEEFDNVTVINEDIMKFDADAYFAEFAEKRTPSGGRYHFKVVANLPYYITTPVLMKLLEG